MAEKKKQVNNTFYDDLDSLWSFGKDHPIALLIAENKVRNPWIIRTIDKELAHSAKILDIGCGGGLLTNPLAKHGHNVTGIDVSCGSLSWAKRTDTTETVCYVCCDGASLPFANESFDVVCAMDLLEHVDDPEVIIQQAARLLRPGGLFFFHTFNRTWMSYLLVIKAVELFVKNTPKDMHLYSHFIKPKELKVFCHNANLEIQQLHGLVPDFFSRAFIQGLFTRTVDDTLVFRMTRSVNTGYLGFAKKVY
jgi:2-polyprenyl-6-hydroxyphenyl methylase/3-demethylubiquinone-9 3-methyltransferase